MTEPQSATVPGCALAGYACVTCARPMLYATHQRDITLPDGRKAVCEVIAADVHRAMWLDGAVEKATGMWACEACSRSDPRLRLQADAVRHGLRRPELVGFEREAVKAWGQK